MERRDFLRSGAALAAQGMLGEAFAKGANTGRAAKMARFAIPPHPGRVDLILEVGRKDPLFTAGNLLEPVYLASQAKLMTLAEIGFEQILQGHLKLDDRIQITKDDHHAVHKKHISGIEGFITVDELFTLGLGQSFNDLPRAFARHVSALPVHAEALSKAGLKPGTEKAFCLGLAQKRAEKLKMFNTWLGSNSHGLPPYLTDNPDGGYNSTTAPDLGLLCASVVQTLQKWPDFMKYFSQQGFKVPHHSKPSHNTNPVLENADFDGARPCRGAYGLKTGTANLGHQLAIAANRPEGHLIVLTLNHKDDESRAAAGYDLVEKGYAIMAENRHRLKAGREAAIPDLA